MSRRPHRPLAEGNGPRPLVQLCRSARPHDDHWYAGRARLQDGVHGPTP